MINVGIIGCGFVGGALKNWLENNNPDCKLFISDPYKGYNDDLSDIDIAFLQIHVPTAVHPCALCANRHPFSRSTRDMR